MAEVFRLSSGKRELSVEPPLLNAAGFLGFGGAVAEGLELDRLGALITPPVSTRPRSPAQDAGVRRLPGGFLLHSGLPNPGLERAIGNNRGRWARLPVPVLIHLIPDSPQDLEAMILRVEREPALHGIEIGVENPRLIEPFGRLARGSELPVVLRLPLDAGPTAFLQAAETGAPALSFGPPRGAWHRDHSAWTGRYYGPSLFPLALQLAANLAGRLEVPLIAAGGLSTAADVRRMLKAGADAVELDYPLWLRPERILDPPPLANQV